jgi:hypothetical protein
MSEITVVDARWAQVGRMPVKEKRVLREVLLCLAGGRAPDAENLARRTSMSLAEVRRTLRVLDGRDFLAVNGDEVRAAYPFTVDEVPHEVRSSHGLARANCAVDALGAGAMLGETIEVRSRCAHCGEPIRLRGKEGFQGSPEKPVVFLPPLEILQGKAVDDLCPEINFYCNEDHGRAGVGGWADRGRLLTLEEATRWGIALFGKLLEATEGA